MGKEHEHTPLLTDETLKRTGSLWTAVAHIITAVIGSGVLSLAWSMAQLGWIAGPLSMIIFAAITAVSTYLLCDCYRSPDPEHGLTRNISYMSAVSTSLAFDALSISTITSLALIVENEVDLCEINWGSREEEYMDECIVSTRRNSVFVCGLFQQVSLYGCGIAYVITASGSMSSGSKWPWVSGLLQYLSIYGTGIAYVIATSTSMRAIQKSNCYHREGHEAPCSYGDSFYMLIFGASEILLSQIPDFHNMEWLSILAAVMSFSYAGIGFALGFAKVVEDGFIKGSITGVTTTTTVQKVWLVSQALGDIAFAYPYSIILLEIQDTLKAPPPENQTMRKASMTAIFITTFFYLGYGCFGFAAFGNQTPGNLLTGFGFYEPYWLVDFANACVVIHLLGGYQVYSQPVFAFVEGWLAEEFPDNGFVNKSYDIKIPFLPVFSLNPLRLCFRTLYVISTTGIAMVIPYFNQVLGLLGALNFWPLSIYFPVQMYFVQRKVAPWTRQWVILQTFSLICLLVSIFALIGSVEGIISAKLS